MLGGVIDVRICSNTTLTIDPSKLDLLGMSLHLVGHGPPKTLSLTSEQWRFLIMRLDYFTK